MACDTCYAASKCPEYKAGYACAYNKMFERFNTRDMSDIIQAMQGIVDYNMARMQKSMILKHSMVLLTHRLHSLWRQTSVICRCLSRYTKQEVLRYSDRLKY